MKRRRKPIQWDMIIAYIVIFVVIVLGTMLGNFLSSVIAAEYVPTEYYTGEVEEVMEIQRRRYDIPLSPELQDYTFDISKQYGVEFELVLAIMWTESDFRYDVISPTLDYGIMQINRINHERLRYAVGVADFLCPRQNIRAGIYMLSEINRRHSYLYQILMIYNAGATGARNMWERGITETAYTRRVIERYHKLRELGVEI